MAQNCTECISKFSSSICIFLTRIQDVFDNVNYFFGRECELTKVKITQATLPENLKRNKGIESLTQTLIF